MYTVLPGEKFIIITTTLAYELSFDIYVIGIIKLCYMRMSHKKLFILSKCLWYTFEAVSSHNLLHTIHYINANFHTTSRNIK